MLEVDVARKRIALTRRLDDAPAPQAPRDARANDPRPPRGPDRGTPRDQRRGPAAAKTGAPPADNALAAAFARAKGQG